MGLREVGNSKTAKVKKRENLMKVAITLDLRKSEPIEGLKAMRRELAVLQENYKYLDKKWRNGEFHLKQDVDETSRRMYLLERVMISWAKMFGADVCAQVAGLEQFADPNSVWFKKAFEPSLM